MRRDFACARGIPRPFRVPLTLVPLVQPEEYAGKSLELAGDQLTPRQLCEEFSLAQGGSPVKQLSLPRFLFWFLNK